MGTGYTLQTPEQAMKAFVGVGLFGAVILLPIGWLVSLRKFPRLHSRQTISPRDAAATQDAMPKINATASASTDNHDLGGQPKIGRTNPPLTNSINDAQKKLVLYGIVVVAYMLFSIEWECDDDHFRWEVRWYDGVQNHFRGTWLPALLLLIATYLKMGWVNLQLGATPYLLFAAMSVHEAIFELGMRRHDPFGFIFLLLPCIAIGMTIWRKMKWKWWDHLLAWPMIIMISVGTLEILSWIGLI